MQNESVVTWSTHAQNRIHRISNDLFGCCCCCCLPSHFFALILRFLTLFLALSLSLFLFSSLSALRNHAEASKHHFPFLFSKIKIALFDFPLNKNYFREMCIKQQNLLLFIDRCGACVTYISCHFLSLIYLMTARMWTICTSKLRRMKKKKKFSI